jgi:membrane associated rhomboid family serine protease
MFFLIPVGSEEGVRRLPYFTIGLIALNAIIFMLTSTVQKRQEQELFKIHQEMEEIEVRYFFDILEQNPNAMQNMTLDEQHELFLGNENIRWEEDDYKVWHELYNEYKIKFNNVVFNELGFTPKHFAFFKLFTHMFVHANFFHLLFNMLFLWLVGCNIEDTWSWKVFLGLYLISGVIACLLHTAVYSASNTPLVGASGAIAGIMGAFMIRHYKTKIRFAYFFWLIFVPPIFGSFAIYAGIALPIWFLMQIVSARWSVGVGTAYYAHIGGFIFGAAVGMGMKFLGIEKKYVAPMVEDSFEKLKMSSQMKEVYKKMDINDTAGAMPLLLAVLGEEPRNFDAPLILARIYYEKGHHDDAMLMYNKALDVALISAESDIVLSVYEELREKGILQKITEKNLYNLAAVLESSAKYKDAVETFGVYVKFFPHGQVRAKALYRVHLLFKNKLDNPAMAQKTHVFLKKEYPDFPTSE